LSAPAGGQVWVTPYATGGVPAFVDVTNNGPQGSINPNQFPVSSVAIDSSDATGHTAYVTVMGFTGGPGHVWKTTNAGAAWADWTGNLPDSPANAVVVYPGLSQVYVATDVGVFASSTAAAGNWTELGPDPGPGQSGFLPNVAVTALGVFNAGGQQLLRASTYGRGVWQFNLVTTPDFEISVTNSPLTVLPGQATGFAGTVIAQNGYASVVTLSCVPGVTDPPSTCTPSPATLTPTTNTPFTVTVGGTVGDYSFNVQGAGSDRSNTTHLAPVILHLVSFGVTTPSPASVTVPRGTTSPAVGFQVTAAGAFNQSVTVSCNSGIANATCTLTPGTTVDPTASAPVNMTASVSVPLGTAVGSYPVSIQATTAGAPTPATTSFSLNVTTNPDFVLTEPTAFPVVNAGSTGTSGTISIASQDGFSSKVTLSCAATYGAGSCSISPASVSSFPATASLTINGTSFAAGSYSLSITGTSSSDVHSLAVPFNVGDYSISGTQALSVAPSGIGTANLTLTASTFYAGMINATCNASALPGAMCALSPANPITVAIGSTASLTATITVPNNASPGIYNIKINTQDSSGAPSHSVIVAMTVAQDFLLTASPPSQTVTAGQTSGPYQLIIQPVGTSFDGAVTLACTAGLPPQAQCIFNPSTAVIPGSAAADVVMSISTVATAKGGVRASASRAAVFQPASYPVMFHPLWLLGPGLMIGLALSRSPRNRRQLILGSMSMLVLVLLTLTLLSCGGVSSGGGGGGCSSVPGIPAGLAPSATTSTGTTLTWTASTAGSGCGVSYTVYQNSTLLATSTSPTFNVSGLSAATQYSFAVSASDSDGASAQSTAINVTTLSGGTGVYHVTVTGTSPGTTPDAGQSTVVTLVVD